MASLKDLAQTTFSLDRLQDEGVPTASIAVLRDGKVDSHVLTSGPENAETVYQAASISKAICGLGLAKLFDEGHLTYDTKVVDHLAADLVDSIVGSDSKTRELMQQVTIKMLLTHTSGLSQHGFRGYSGFTVPSVEDIVCGKYLANTPRMRFLSFPGSQCSYSGGGYTILQLVLESITGTGFAELMQQTVFTRLGMGRSWYGDLPPGETNYTRGHFTAHVATEAERGYHVLPELAAAGLWTTPSDLLKAVSAIQESLYTEVGFLKRETAKLMLTKVASVDWGGNVGLGPWVNDVAFGHGGDNDPGYCTWFAGFHAGANGSDDGNDGEGAQPRNGIAIMTNSALGHQTCVKQIIGAIMHAQGWSGSTGKDDLWLPHARDAFVPYPAPHDIAVDEGWQTWKGKWEGGWEIVEEEDGGGPALKFEEFPGMSLRPAAAPVKVFDGEKKEVWLVVEGLSIGVRLTWVDEGKGEEVMRLQLEDEKVLKRVVP